MTGQLSEVRALASLTAETVVERRPTVIADLDGTTLRFQGKSVTFPAHAREELEAVFAAAEPFRPRELPGDLDEEGRFVLVKRLIREGFLRHSAEGV